MIDSELMQNAHALYRDNRPAEAVAAVEAAIRSGTDSAHVHNALGVYRTAAGDFAGAEAALRDAIRMDPALVPAYHNLLELRHVEVAPDLLSQMLALAGRADLGAADAALLDYCISRSYRRRQDRESEFRYLDRAKAAMARLKPWDEAGFAADVATVLAMAKPDYERWRNATAPAPAPIIICSMPRAGSTLLEQILGAHRDIASIGEAGLATRATQAAVTRHQLAEPLFPSWLRLPSPAAVLATACAAFAELLAAYPVGRARFCEKSVNNDVLLGLWLLAYPQARVLHLRRHPLDVCLSCYQSYFANGVAFSNRLEWVAARYRWHERLMSHWRQLFPAQVMTVAYEDLVRAPQAEVRRVLDFLGLPWDENCLAFHRSDAAVRTASNWQVRQPLYQDSVHRWELYREQLAPIMHLADA